MNFRSVPELCDWANDVFETQFPAEPTGTRRGSLPLDAEAGAEDRPARCCTLTHTCDKRRAFTTEDAEQIARYIRSEVDAGRRQFSDFLILTRKKNDRIAPYAHALEALNIPIEVSGAGAFGESREVAGAHGAAARAGRSAGSAVARRRAAWAAVRHQRSGAVRFKQRGGWFSVFQRIADAPGQPDGVRRLLRWPR